MPAPESSQDAEVVRRDRDFHGNIVTKLSSPNRDTGQDRCQTHTLESRCGTVTCRSLRNQAGSCLSHPCTTIQGTTCLPDLTGRTVDNGCYLIEATLGSSSWGTVYQARIIQAIILRCDKDFFASRVKCMERRLKSREIQLHEQDSEYPYTVTLHQAFHEATLFSSLQREETH
jgi:hypothetical protein